MGHPQRLPKQGKVMTDPNYTAVMLVVDRSGSMEQIRVAAEDSINEFIHGQATATGKRTIRITQFDTDPNNRMAVSIDDTVPTLTPAADIPPFQLSPRGGTPLLDAMAYSIRALGHELAALPEDERPGTVILAVMTDGKENSSREHTSWEEIAAMVQRQENEFGWQVLYLGANQDAIAVGAKLGVRRERSMTYAATDHGTRSVVGAMRDYVASAAAGTSAAFTSDQRDDAAR